MSGPQPPPPGWQPEPEASPPPWGRSYGEPAGQRPAPPPGWTSPPPPGWTSPPPPGWTSPPQSGWAPAPPPGWAQAPQPVAHKPGAIPLRPLVLGDIFDGAFRIIRYNPKATIGAAVLVSAVAMTVPVIIGLVSGSTGGLQPDPSTGELSDSQLLSLLVALGGLLIGTQLQSIGLLFVSGMIAHVTSAAAVGRKLTIGEAWAATEGKRWRLLGMSLMLGLAVALAVGIALGVLLVGAVAFDAPVGALVVVGLGLAAILVVALMWFWVRVRALAVPTLMLEPVGIWKALGRAVRLTRQQFWRLLGLLLLTTLVVGVAGSILQLPFTITGQVFLTSADETTYGLLIYLLLSGLGSVVSSAVLAPFSSAVTALLYIDQRMRKEAYDVDLMTQAGFLPA